jgi:hypothetical protein
MGTRSTIAVENADKTITAIYCHWDGYPTHVGKILNEHYTNPKKVAELMALGDLSSLGREIGGKTDFDSHKGHDTCLAYGRDRGETDVGAKVFVSKLVWKNEMNKWEWGCEYAYLFKRGKWTHTKL